MNVQIRLMSQGGSDAPTPDLSIEVDDLNAAPEHMQAPGFPIKYGPAEEIRRFYVTIPSGSSLICSPASVNSANKYCGEALSARRN